MPTQFQVTDRVQLTGHGLTITGLILGDQVSVKAGNVFTEESTGATVRVRGVEMHTQQTPEGTQYGLAIEESIPGSIQPGAVLTLRD